MDVDFDPRERDRAIEDTLLEDETDQIYEWWEEERQERGLYPRDCRHRTFLRYDT